MAGCAVSFQDRDSQYQEPIQDLSQSQREEVYASLSQRGQFTKATILKNIHDSAALDIGGSEVVGFSHRGDDSIQPAENRLSAADTQLQKQEKDQPSALLVSLPPRKNLGKVIGEKGHRELGWSFLITGNYEGAAAAYRQAIRKNQDSAEAYLGLGSALKMQKDLPGAIDAYEQALQLKPDYTAALVHLGSIYAEGGSEHQDIQQAKRLLSRAMLQGDPFAKIALKDLKARE